MLNSAIIIILDITLDVKLLVLNSGLVLFLETCFKFLSRLGI
jgi:hypothetical protein